MANTLNVAGILSGTSVDGISYAICKIGWRTSKTQNGDASSAQKKAPSLSPTSLIDRGINLRVLYNDEGKWPSRVREVLLALADPTRKIEISLLQDVSIEAEVASLVSKCVLERNDKGHKCIGCGWREGELVKIEKRARAILKVLPNPLSSDTSSLSSLDFHSGVDSMEAQEVYEKKEKRIVNPSMAISEANFLVAECFAVVLKEGELRMRREKGMETERIDLIGSHGQTIWHHPSQSELIPCDGDGDEMGRDGGVESRGGSKTREVRISSSLQIGDTSTLANRMTTTVVGGFRTSDVSMGGQGAPLTSSLDIFLLSHLSQSGHWIALQNLGGMGNVTLIPPHYSSQYVSVVQENDSSLFPIAFDTGPANVLLDWFIGEMTNGKMMYDDQGREASQGKPNRDFLLHMLSHPYFRISPPKTCGREVFTSELGKKWREEAREGKEMGKGSMGSESTLSWSPLSDYDFLATLVDLTASSIVLSILRFVPIQCDPPSSSSYSSSSSSQPNRIVPFPSKIVLAGGGSHNTYLKGRIEYWGKEAILGHMASLESQVYGDNSRSSFLKSISSEGAESWKVETSDGANVADSQNSLQRHDIASENGIIVGSTSNDQDHPKHPFISSDAKEGVLFALLAFLTLHGIPSSIPSCTGASRPSILGSIAPSSNYHDLLSFIMMMNQQSL
jgi:1,6-anhydro-N-acetylmuramate kinase